ncbi:efflux RND transporter periplasmic adaptor subunit [Granulicella sp. WH15]|uniref:efflux RND transporter periplasmic adaptor subunit n=1 Tax=Granulicella sp. WH15 TaxID=2602070 RepID=UPI002103C4BF|nr:efflux RND transporter periplasmic adaptor subunit [Granulicella sp. WH15]
MPASQPQKSQPEPEGKSGGGIVRRVLIVLVLVGVAAFAVWKIRQNQAEQAVEADRTVFTANRPIPVQMTAVVQKTMPIYLTALGTVTPYYSVTVKSRVDGELMSVNVREGQAVRKGQLLAQIDPRPYQAALAQAVGQLAKDQAAANYNAAEASRYTSLYQAGVVSKESQQTQISNAGQSTGTLDADRAAIQAAQVNVTYTRILSPIDGVVGLRQVDPGNIVHAADATGLILVTQLQPISVIFTLPEDQLPQVLKLMRAGSKLAVEAYDRSETTHLASGSLLTIDNTIDTTTGTVKGKAVYANQDNALFPNQFVNVRIVLQQRPNALVIPASAIQNGIHGTFVYVVKPGAGKMDAETAAKLKPVSGHNFEAEDDNHGRPKFHVEVQPVVVDLIEGSQVILKSGLEAGDNVVTDGQEKLKEQSNVSPKQTAASANGPSTQPLDPGKPSHKPRGLDAADNADASTDGRGKGHKGQKP